MNIVDLIQSRMDEAEKGLSDFCSRIMFCTPNPIQDPEGFASAANRITNEYRGKPPYERWNPTPEEKKDLERRRRFRRRG